MFDYSMVRRLELTRKNMVPSFIQITDYMFANGQYSWGRIVVVYAFIGWIVRYCCNRACDASSASKVSNCDVESARQMTACIGDYLARRLTTWIRKHGGWMHVAKFNFQMSTEKALWQRLLYGFVCIATLCVMSAVR